MWLPHNFYMGGRMPRSLRVRVGSTRWCIWRSNHSCLLFLVPWQHPPPAPAGGKHALRTNGRRYHHPHVCVRNVRVRAPRSAPSLHSLHVQRPKDTCKSPGWYQMDIQMRMYLGHSHNSLLHTILWNYRLHTNYLRNHFLRNGN